jgi:hypothetical protein
VCQRLVVQEYGRAEFDAATESALHLKSLFVLCDRTARITTCRVIKHDTDHDRLCAVGIDRRHSGVFRVG